MSFNPASRQQKQAEQDARNREASQKEQSALSQNVGRTTTMGFSPGEKQAQEILHDTRTNAERLQTYNALIAQAEGKSAAQRQQEQAAQQTTNSIAQQMAVEQIRKDQVKQSQTITSASSELSRAKAELATAKAQPDQEYIGGGNYVTNRGKDKEITRIQNEIDFLQQKISGAQKNFAELDKAKKSGEYNIMFGDKQKTDSSGKKVLDFEFTKSGQAVPKETGFVQDKGIASPGVGVLARFESDLIGKRISGREKSVVEEIRFEKPVTPNISKSFSSISYEPKTIKTKPEQILEQSFGKTPTNPLLDPKSIKIKTVPEQILDKTFGLGTGEAVKTQVRKSVSSLFAPITNIPKEASDIGDIFSGKEPQHKLGMPQKTVLGETIESGSKYLKPRISDVLGLPVTQKERVEADYQGKKLATEFAKDPLHYGLTVGGEALFFGGITGTIKGVQLVSQALKTRGVSNELTKLLDAVSIPKTKVEPPAPREIVKHGKVVDVVKQEIDTLIGSKSLAKNKIRIKDVEGRPDLKILEPTTDSDKLVIAKMVGREKGKPIFEFIELTKGPRVIQPKGARIRGELADTPKEIGSLSKQFDLTVKGTPESKFFETLTATGKVTEQVEKGGLGEVGRLRVFTQEQLEKNPTELGRFLFSKTTLAEKPPVGPTKDIALTETKGYGVTDVLFSGQKRVSDIFVPFTPPKTIKISGEKIEVGRRPTSSFVTELEKQVRFEGKSSPFGTDIIKYRHGRPFESTFGPKSKTKQILEKDVREELLGEVTKDVSKVKPREDFFGTLPFSIGKEGLRSGQPLFQSIKYPSDSKPPSLQMDKPSNLLDIEAPLVTPDASMKKDMFDFEFAMPKQKEVDNLGLDIVGKLDTFSSFIEKETEDQLPIIDIKIADLLDVGQQQDTTTKQTTTTTTDVPFTPFTTPQRPGDAFGFKAGDNIFLPFIGIPGFGGFGRGLPRGRTRFELYKDINIYDPFSKGPRRSGIFSFGSDYGLERADAFYLKESKAISDAGGFEFAGTKLFKGKKKKYRKRYKGDPFGSGEFGYKF